MLKHSIKIFLPLIVNGKHIFQKLIGMEVKTNIIYGYLEMEKIEKDY